MKPREAEKDVAGEFEQWKEVFQARAKDVDAQLRQEAGEPPESPLIQTKMPTIQEFEKNFPTKDKEVAAYIDEWDRADEAYKIRKDAQLAKKGEFARERCRR
jgi:molybdopterin converting factor small subunit